MSRLRYLLPIVCLLLVACQPPAPRNPRPEQLSYPPLTFRVPAVEQLDLPNGIRLYLQEDHELPLVEVSAMLPAGSIADPEGKTGLADLYATVLRSGGAGDYPPDAFDELLAERAIDLSASSGSYTLNLGLSLQSEDLPVGLRR